MLNRFRKFLDKKFPNRDWRSFGEIVKSIAEICALSLLLYEFFHETSGIKFWVYMFAIILLTFALATTTYGHLKQKKSWQEERKQLQRDAKFAKVLSKINRGFSDTHKVLGIEMEEKKKLILNLQKELKEIKEKIKNPCQDATHNNISSQIDSILSKILITTSFNQEGYLIAFEKFCGDISEVFSAIISSNTKHEDVKCGVCIKHNIPGKNTLEESKVFTLIRNRNSKDRYGVGFDKKKLRSYKDNTAFRDVWESIIKDKKKKFFFCNSLPVEIDRGYSNESFKDTNADPDYLKKLSLEDRRKYWPLDYKSTIVAPIFTNNNVSSGTEIDGDAMMGFLCIDCNYEDVFSEETDAPLLVGCAEGMYNAIKQFQDKIILNQN